MILNETKEVTTVRKDEERICSGNSDRGFIILDLFPFCFFLVTKQWELEAHRFQVQMRMVDATLHISSGC